MPFPLKIQPVDFNSPVDSAFSKPVVKSRFKRLFERPFGNVLRTSAPEKVVTDAGADQFRDVCDEFEPSSVCLANMVKNFIEESNDKTTSLKCCRSRCYCNRSDCSDDELDSSHSYACELLKSLVMCSSVFERNLLADTASIVEKNKISKCKDDSSRKLVTDGLLALGYDASICKSRWEKAPSYPAGTDKLYDFVFCGLIDEMFDRNDELDLNCIGEYDYVDVIKDDERLIVDIDFRSEFKIARSTNTYKTILQTLPRIFVGKADRLQKIIYLVSEAAKQSLKKKGMPFPPWRKAEYVKSKWLSPYTRTPPPSPRLSLAPPLTLMDSADLKTDGQFPVIGNKKITPTSSVNSSASSDHGGDTVFTMSEEDEDA